MKDLSIADDIIPIGQFKAQASRLLKRISADARPIVITQNGRPAAVVMSPAEYDRIRYREQFLQSIVAGVTDADAGRVMSTKSLRKRLVAGRSRSGER